MILTVPSVYHPALATDAMFRELHGVLEKG